MADPSDRCRLYLVVDDDTAVLAALGAAFESSDVACVLMRGAAIRSDEAAELVALAQERGVAVLIEDDIELAETLGADGVHASDEEHWRDARDALGSGVIVGAAATPSRHVAMTLAEDGADYIAFEGTDTDALIDSVVWWADLFTTPSVAFAGDEADVALALAEAGADFVALSPALWRDPEALAAIEAALAKPRRAA